MDIVEKIAQEFNLKPEQAVIMLVELDNEVKSCELSAVEAWEELSLDGYRLDLAA